MCVCFFWRIIKSDELFGWWYYSCCFWIYFVNPLGNFIVRKWETSVVTVQLNIIWSWNSNQNTFFCCGKKITKIPHLYEILILTAAIWQFFENLNLEIFVKNRKMPFICFSKKSQKVWVFTVVWWFLVIFEMTCHFYELYLTIFMKCWNFGKSL